MVLHQEVQSFEVELQKDPFALPAQQLTFKGAPATILKAGFCPGEQRTLGER